VSEAYRTSIDIDADADVVFDYFVKPELLVRWMGDYARLEAQDGGLFSVDINGVLIRGTFVRVERPHLIEIAWGEAGNVAMPPGSTKLVVRLERRGAGTRVELEHSGLVHEEAEKHAQGWPYFLGRLGVAAPGGAAGPDRYAPRDVVVRFNDAIGARDLAALAALMSDGHRFVDPTGRVLDGKAACVDAWRRLFEALPASRNTFDEIVVREDVVAVRGRSHGAVSELDGPALWQARVNAGLVVEWRVFADDPETRTKLGLQSSR
jgi:uncharacterized protein YndB with AHSA1/START domain/ketosteroid isomerase-like protein